MTAAFTAGYEAGKNKGYEEGYEAGRKDGIEAHLKALKAEGLVIVPREPTDEMLVAGCSKPMQPFGQKTSGHIWQAMLAALEGKE